MKLRFKLTLIMIAIMVVIISTISVVLLQRASALQITAAQENLESDTAKYAAQLASHYQQYLDAAEAAGQVMSGYEDIAPDERRGRIRETLLSLFNANKNWVGVYSVWKPGILDGMDSLHTGDVDADEAGNFIPWFVRSNGQVKLQSYNEAPFELSRMSADHRVTDPSVFYIDGEEDFSVTLISPIQRQHDGEVVGIVGIQVNLNYTQELIRDIKPYGVGSAGLASPNGTIVAHHEEALIGTTLQDNSEWFGADEVLLMEDALETGTPVVMTEKVDRTLRQFYPFYIGEAVRPWAIIASVNEAVVMKSVHTMKIFTFIIASAAVLIAALIIFVFISNIIKPIVTVALTLKDISEGAGDLTKTIEVKGKDEIADLARYFNKTLEKIRNMVVTIKKQAGSLFDIGNKLAANMTETAAAINEITANIQSIKGRVINQSASVTETNATMEQITVNIDKLNGHVENQTISVSKSSSAIEEMIANIQSVTNTLAKNTESVQDLTEASDVGRAGLQEVSTDIQEIAEESKGLLEINKVMQNIAAETNLLSMNAAIEAAHAGEAGKGFAVVADEIRKLAENSSEQSKTISTVLNKIKDGIDKITRSTGNVMDKFEVIDTGVKTVSQQSENIRSAMEEQSAGSQQILEVISQLNGINQMVTGGSTEMLEGSKEIILEVKNLEMATQEITNGMNEMAAGADQINIAVNEVNTISGDNKENIDVLVREVSKFKVE